MTQTQLITKIEGLQQTRRYAAPEVRQQLTAEIERLWKLYDEAAQREARRLELEADLEAARMDLQHGSTPTWRNAARKSIALIEAELEALGN